MKMRKCEKKKKTFIRIWVQFAKSGPKKLKLELFWGQIYCLLSWKIFEKIFFEGKTLSHI